MAACRCCWSTPGDTCHGEPAFAPKAACSFPCSPAQVKAFKPTVARLFTPLAAALLATPAAAATSSEDGSSGEEEGEARLLAALLEVYEWPDRHAGVCIIATAESSEGVETPQVHISAVQG